MSPVLTTLKTDDINRWNNARSHTDGESAMLPVTQWVQGFFFLNIFILNGTLTFCRPYRGLRD